ncbi:MAG: aldehyde dehydrogenase family protein, partial [Rhizobiaceae bacterium]
MSESSIEAIVARSKAAQARYENGGSQERYDRATQAAAWAMMEPARNRDLAELAVQTTGLGNVPDKITKNHRKTLGLMRDLKDAVTYGVISDEPATGITEIARAKGVVGAIVPSTNPAATPANNIINALKCGNSIVIAPSPKGVACAERLLGYVHAEFAKIGEDPNLVQMVPAPGSKEKTQALMAACDMIVATGSQNNVHRAQTAGTPAVAVGAGNVTVIVDETADLEAAAEKV